MDDASTMDQVKADLDTYIHEAVPQGFDWNLQFNWHAVPDHEKNKHSHRACGLHTMAGGMFSVDKAFSDRHLQ